MELLLIGLGVLVALLVLDLAAIRWGADSTDGLDSPEWERRRGWPGHGTRRR